MKVMGSSEETQLLLTGSFSTDGRAHDTWVKVVYDSAKKQAIVFTYADDKFVKLTKCDRIQGREIDNIPDAKVGSQAGAHFIVECNKAGNIFDGTANLHFPKKDLPNHRECRAVSSLL